MQIKIQCEDLLNILYYFTTDVKVKFGHDKCDICYLQHSNTCRF